MSFLLLPPSKPERKNFTKFFFTRFFSVDLLLIFFFRYKNILIKFRLSGRLEIPFSNFPLAVDNFRRSVVGVVEAGKGEKQL